MVNGAVGDAGGGVGTGFKANFHPADFESCFNFIDRVDEGEVPTAIPNEARNGLFQFLVSAATKTGATKLVPADSDFDLDRAADHDEVGEVREALWLHHHKVRAPRRVNFN